MKSATALIPLDAETRRTTLYWVTAIDVLTAGPSGLKESSPHCSFISKLVSHVLLGRPKKLLLKQRKNFTNKQSSSHLENPLTSVCLPFWRISRGLDKPCMSEVAPCCRLAMRNVRTARPQTPELLTPTEASRPRLLLHSLHMARGTLTRLVAQVYRIFLLAYPPFTSQ